MSFSSDVKAELARRHSKSMHCQIAELTAMIMFEGRISTNPLELIFASENPTLLEKYAILMKRAFGMDISKPLDEADCKKIIEAIQGLYLDKICCKRAFIRGAFMATGSMSDPNKAYHFEIVCKSVEQAQRLQELMQEFRADAKIVERKHHFVVYLKDGSQIVDMLNVMEAYVSLMNLENVRIVKEVRNSINRKVNCETANISKTVNAAVKQITDIEKIRDELGLEHLPKPLQEAAYVRLEHPEAPLRELGNYLQPPVGKSGMNHRLRKLAKIAEDLTKPE
ncbi:MAG: DNA-binding protein WhiA [Lachnospiraceae bacterium]|nr:DNA-binding protein WhiA [Lachnospiraceae bacterium]